MTILWKVLYLKKKTTNNHKKPKPKQNNKPHNNNKKDNKIIAHYLRAHKLFLASYVLTSIENCKMFYDKFLPWQKSWVKSCVWDVTQKWVPTKTLTSHYMTYTQPMGMGLCPAGSQKSLHNQLYYLSLRLGRCGCMGKSCRLQHCNCFLPSTVL